MYEIAYGSKYHESNQGVYMPTAEIAKLIRADIKAAINDGKLPGKVSNYSVRSENFSGGRAIRVLVRDLEGMWKSRPADEHDSYSREVLTDEGERILKVLKEIHASYNYDGSEVQYDYFNVNYYGQVEIESLWSQNFRRREALKARLKKALRAATSDEERERLIEEWVELNKE